MATAADLLAREVHQFGDACPPTAAFNPAHVPDQSSRTHTGNLAWTGNKASR